MSWIRYFDAPAIMGRGVASATKSEIFSLLLVVALCFPFSGGSLARAENAATSKVWTLDEAVAMVESTQYGQVLRVREVSAEQECPVYRMRVLTQSGRIKSYSIDGCTRDFVKEQREPARANNIPMEAEDGEIDEG